ncbi:MAG: class I SAM-dependent RNA methyltransferase [Aeriscardovia sp.]|nr:class I SAM-dependent RNA methyltransferase [Aeriscardovia sp.]
MAAKKYRVLIERFADQGRCVAHVDGRVVFVRFALPGEDELICIDEPARPSDKFWTGEVEEVYSPSPFRVPPSWPEAGPVSQGGGLGGADLCHVSLEGQIEWKRQVIESQLERLAKVKAECPVERLQFDVDNGGLYWRSRIDLVANKQGFPSMRKRGSRSLVPIRTMPLCCAPLLQEAGKAGIWGGGLPANAPVRLSIGNGKEEGNFSISVGGKIVSGKGELSEEVTLADRRYHYKVRQDCFWQVHILAAQTLVSYVFSLAKEFSGKRAWDLYSGSGLFTLPLGSLFGEVKSVEQAPLAVEAARKNAGKDPRFDIRRGEVAKAIPSLGTTPDLTVADPSRAGLGREVCGELGKKGVPALVYVSCNPTTFARDCGFLAEDGYSMASLKGFDLYPSTHHVEVAGLFLK